jgi:DNA-binding CsgD family transcriptional regulator
MTAPLQLIGLTFPLDADVESRLLAEVDRIQGRGVLRVLDMVLMARGRDGVIEAMEVGDAEDFGSLLASVSPFGAQNGDRPAAGEGAAGQPAGSGVAAVQALAESLEPGSAVALLLVEHLWAGPLVDAVSAAGGALVSDDFLAGDVSLAVGAEVAAVEEASAVIAEAQAAEATAVLRAIAASAQAAEAEAASERIQEAAAADAVSALIAAGLIEAAAAHQAVTALTAAGLITEAAAQASGQAVADAAATIAAADQAAAEAVAEDVALVGAADDAADEAVAEDVALMGAADDAAAEAVAEDVALMGAADEAAAEATKRAQARTRAASITRSEAQILQYLPQPVPFSVIADKLGISRSAAKERAERLYQRLGVHTRDDAVSRARALGLLGR